MATTTIVTTSANGQDETGALTPEKSTYKGFATLDEKGDVKTVNAKAESANQDSWKKMIASGATEWNENEFVKYIVHTLDGFKMLIPDEAQQLYIIQSGLNYVQNSKANALMVERKEGAGNENFPAYNGETIDLREHLNVPPSKRSLTDQQKIERLVKSLGLKPDEMTAMFAELSKRFAGQASSTEEEEAVAS